MKDDSYRMGFITTLTQHGFNKESSEALYKKAGTWRAVAKGLSKDLSRSARGLGSAGKSLYTTGRGLFDVGKGLFDAGVGIARPMARGISYLTNEGWLSPNKGLNWLLKRKLLKNTSFAKGYLKAQRTFEQRARRGSPLSLLQMLGGKGSLPGNLLAGLGSFSKEHPLLGALGIAVPTAWATKNYMKDNDGSKSSFDTLTETQRRAFERAVHAKGYGSLGFDARDVDMFGSL